MTDFEKQKQCVHCGAAQDTAKLWKLKCSSGRHNFQEVTVGHPYYTSGHSINADGFCNMGCC